MTSPDRASSETNQQVSTSAAADGGWPVVVRPHRIRAIVIPIAIGLIALFAVVGALLKSGTTGVHFELSDQVSMALLGVVLAAAVLLLLRPRVRANATTVEVRNVLTAQRFAWTDTRGMTFPDGAPWARLELFDDEYQPVMAVQAADRDRAVAAMRELRRLYRASGADVGDRE